MSATSTGLPLFGAPIDVKRAQAGVTKAWAELSLSAMHLANAVSGSPGASAEPDGQLLIDAHNVPLAEAKLQEAAMAYAHSKHRLALAMTQDAFHAEAEAPADRVVPLVRKRKRASKAAAPKRRKPAKGGGRR